MAVAFLPVELQREVNELERLRGALHDAFIVEQDAAHVTSPHSASAVLEPHRTLDASTLRLLRSPNYPFALCEEAPSSYIPPPVPFDVEGEVERLKAGVLRIQEELLAYTDSLLATGPNASQTANHVKESSSSSSHSKSGRAAVVPAITSAQVLQFLASNPYYAELAFQVSALQWFHRWVLSHSVTLLCNAKEQLEYVLTERGQLVPDEVAVMDDCLREFAFPTAVAMLTADRQHVIAEERRRLHSASRTYRDRLPPTAISVARSSYLTTEEKYMYQEFYNQSEHTLLLYNHTSIAVKAPLLPASQSAAQDTHHNNDNSKEEDATAGLERNERGSSQGNSTRANSVNTLRSSLGPSPQDLRVLAEDLGNVLGAEREMIAMLLDTIRERRAKGIVYDISPQDYQRSRRAQIAVYGCVMSDISLMSYQMHIAAEFLTRYEDWLRYHDLDSHDAVMARLCAMHTGIRWPALPSHSPSASSVAHSHVSLPQLREIALPRSSASTTRPTLVSAASPATRDDGVSVLEHSVTTPRPQQPPRMTAQEQPRAQKSEEQEQAGTEKTKKEAAAKKVRRARQPRETGQAAASQSAVSNSWNVAQPSASHESPTHITTPHAVGDAVREMPPAFLALLRAMDAAQPSDLAASSALRDKKERTLIRQANCVPDAAIVRERLWLMACLHHTVVQLAIGAWATPRATWQRLQDVLCEAVRQAAPQQMMLQPVAAALACVLHRFFALLHTAHADAAGRTQVAAIDIPVAVFMPSGTAYNHQHVQNAQGKDLLSSQAAALELLRRPSESVRWGAFLDALWFEADPSQLTSGGMLHSSQGAEKASPHAKAAVFQRLAGVRLTPAALTSNAAAATTAASRAGARLCATLQLRYCARAEDEHDDDDDDVSTRREDRADYVTLAMLIERCNKAGSGDSTEARYAWTHAVLRALAEAEVHGVLPRYACRIAETPQVSLADVLYLCKAYTMQPKRHINNNKKDDGGDGSSAQCITRPQEHYTWRVCLPVPAALELLRLHRHLGAHATPAQAEVGTPFMMYESPRSWSTVGLLLADVLSQLALPAPPLTSLFMLAANLRAQSLSELENKLPAPAFARTSANALMSIRCAPHDDRAVSIQRDSLLSPSKVPRLIAPLLAELEAHLARIDMH